MRFPQALAIGPDGSVYVADQGSHVVQVFGPDGVFRREFGIAGTKPGQLSGVGALAVAGDGSVLVADGANRIDRFDANGQLMNSWGGTGSDVGKFRFGGGSGNTAAAGGGLAVSGDAVYVADTGNDRIQRFTLDGGHGAEIVPPGQLANPRGIAVRRTRLFVADDQHHRLVVFDTGGHLLRAVGQNGSGPGQLNFPYGVATDAPGRVFVADDLNHRVVRFSSGPVYPYKGRWGSYGTAPGRLAYPRGIAVDAAGNVYVANTGNDRIDVFDKGGALLRSFGASGRAAGQFDAPVGVASDAGGIRAVTDSVNGRVQLLNPDGSPASSWGSPAPGPTILPDPVAVAFDAGGNAYVLDRRRSRIVVFARATGLPGAHDRLARQRPGPAAQPVGADHRRGRHHRGGRLGQRAHRALRHRRQLPGRHHRRRRRARHRGERPTAARTYLSTASHRIEVYDPSGSEVDEFGGEGSKIGKLESPGQIALDAAGNLWVADRGNNRIQEFGPGGERLGAFGVRGVGLGEFVHPSGLSLDCNGVLTVTDSDNNRVQQFTLTAPATHDVRRAAAGRQPAGAEAPDPARAAGPAGDAARPAQRPASCRRARCRCAWAATRPARSPPPRPPPPPRRRRKKHRRVTVALATVKLTLGAGDTKIARPTLSRANARRLVKALRGRRALDVNVQISATATTGEPAAVTKRLRATR